MNTKRVFVGSSTEGKPFADTVIRSLKETDLSPLAWFDFFKASRPPLQELEHLTLHADAAVLIATADDQTIIRQKKWCQMRDNVLFEYGLFAGKIGRAKCGLIIPDTEDFRIPSDFLGVTCFEFFDGNNIESAAKATVQSLVTTLQKPQRDETTELRGRRLLRLIGWIRDESLRLVQDWDNKTGRDIVAARIVAVSGFLQEDVDQLKMRKEYDSVEMALLDGIKNFPDVDRSASYRRDMKSAMKDMMRGGVHPHLEVLKGFLHMYDQAGIIRRCDSDCECYQYWQNRHDWRRYGCKEYPGYHHCCDFGCSNFAYAMGAAEAATVFEQMSYSPIPRLKVWSKRFVLPLNDAVAKFERKLHEQIFGNL